MTIDLSDNSPRVSCDVAAGVTQSSFTVSFEFFDNEDLNVYIDGTLKTLTTDYTVAGGDGSTGTITMSVTGASGGSTVVITRSIDLERTTDFPSSGPFNIASLNTELDRFVAIAADLEDQASRALKITDYDPAVSLTIPLVDARKGKTLAFNEATGAVEIGPSIANVQSVSDASADIKTLAEIQDGTVATDAITNVNTIRANVNTVSSISSDVTTVSGISSDVTTVVGFSSDVTTVASISNDVATVSGISADVSAVAAEEANIGTVSTNISNVNTVAGISGNVTTVAGISSDVTSVAGDAADIGTVATNISSVNTVAGISADVSTVASDSTDISTVAGISGNVTTVAGANSNVTTVATNIASVNTAASNIAEIQNASANAATATTKAAEAASSASSASTSASNAASSASTASASADAALAALDNFDDRYLGQKASDPTLDNDGDALVAGALYFNTSDDVMKVYEGSVWVAAYASLSGALLVGNNLSDVADAAASRTNLGLGTGDSPTFTGITATSGELDLDTLDLNAIAASKGVTAVDVFVYDTSKDSDGGAWRKRTQGTSWYNETLNTATRGSRREFPAVAVIVAETNKVTIYDGDDPALPMWMVFNAAANNYIYQADITSVHVLNGQMGVGQGTSAGLSWTDFVADRNICSLSHNTANYKIATPISTRNGGSRILTTDVLIVSGTVNDVAMTVLPNAPIDAATGLPVPVIAVATDGGVSVIADSGAVYDSAKTTAATDATIDGERLRIAFTDSDVLAYDLAPIAADGFTGDIYDPATTPALLGTTTTLSKSASGSSIGMTLLAEDEATPANSMIAQVTSSYNSGYQNGDIKGAFLSDTDDTDLVGSGELVTNGTFDTDLTGWTSLVNATWDAGELNCVSGGFQQNSVFTGAKTVRLSWDQTVNSGTRSRVRLRNATGSVDVGPNNYYTGTGPQSIEISTADGLSVWFSLDSGTDINFDNISVVELDADRSVNANGLIVNGTVTRSPVATGADLVAYSGFSASNYLEQPYNSDLDFGTGDFCVMGWLKMSSLQNAYLLSRGDTSLAGGHLEIVALSNGQFRLWIGATGRDVAFGSTLAYSAGSWNFLTLVRTGSSLKWYVNALLGNSASSTYDVSNAAAIARFGLSVTNELPATSASLALLRISATAPTAEQIAKIYNDEKVLFQENAGAVLAGTSDAVTALAYDDDTNLLHVGTSDGRSVFQGLRRVENTTTAVGTAISANNGLVVEE